MAHEPPLPTQQAVLVSLQLHVQRTGRAYNFPLNALSSTAGMIASSSLSVWS